MSAENVVKVRTSEEIESGNGLDTDALVAKDAALGNKVQKSIRKSKDPRNKLKEECEAGSDFVEQATFRKKHFKKWTRKEYSDLVTQHEDRAKFEQSIDDARVDVSVKSYGLIESLKVTNPLVTSVSFYRIANHFLPMFEWSVTDLEGRIKPEWLTWIRANIDLNSEDRKSADGELIKPVSIADLKSSIDAEKLRQKEEAKRNDKRTPEAIDLAEQKAANAKMVAKRQAAIGRVSKVVSEILSEDHIDIKDIRQTVSSVAKSFNVDSPTSAGLDPKTATKEQIQAFIAGLYAMGRISEIRDIFDVTGQMMAEFSKAKVELKEVA